MVRQQEIVATRRAEFYLLMTHGARLSDVVTIIEQKYGTSRRQLYKDWADRDQWGPEFTEPAKRDRIVQDTLFGLTELRARLWKVVDGEPPYDEADIKDKLKAIIELVNLEFRTLEAAQSLGMAPTEPIKLDVKTRAQWIDKQMDTICGNDDKLKGKMTELLYQFVDEPVVIDLTDANKKKGKKAK
jgi:hypothetical protein